MPALDQGTAVMTLAALAGQSAFVATVTPLKLRLMISAPTASATGTQLTGSGYTAGGQTITFATPTPTTSGGLMLSNIALTWTNGGGAPWIIVGGELWDSSATPVRKAFGLWDSQPIQVNPGAPFSLAAGACGWAFP